MTDIESRTIHDYQIVSGGQTGVDRAALDAAIALGIKHGGWCPRGRLAEDGPIPDSYHLSETDSTEYWIRTEKNVVESDGTLILYRDQLSGGTELTFRMTRKHGKPCLRIDLSTSPTPLTVTSWLNEYNLHIVNVAGPRESSALGIGKEAREFIEQVFSSSLIP